MAASNGLLRFPVSPTQGQGVRVGVGGWGGRYTRVQRAGGRGHGRMGRWVEGHPCQQFLRSCSIAKKNHLCGFRGGGGASATIILATQTMKRPTPTPTPRLTAQTPSTNISARINTHKQHQQNRQHHRQHQTPMPTHQQQHQHRQHSHQSHPTPPNTN